MSSITSKLLTILIPFLLILAIVFLALYHALRENELQLQQSQYLEKISSTYASALTYPLWSFDQNTVESMIQTIASTPDISCVVLEDEILGKRWESEANACSQTINTKHEIAKSISHEDKRIALLSIYFNEASVKATLKAEIVQGLFLVVSLLSMLLVGALMVQKYVVGRPLNHLLGSIQRSKKSDHFDQVNWSSNDEFGLIVDGFNELIHQQHESEEKYRLLFEQSEDPMWVIIGDRFRMANNAAARKLKYDSTEDLLNTHPSSFSPPMQADGASSTSKVDDMMKIAYEQGYHRFEWNHQDKEGQIIPVEVSLTRIPYEHQDALFCVWRDISDWKSAETSLKKARIEAEQASLAKSQFLATMSHEIRTPMSGVMGFADMLLEDDLSAESRDKVNQIRESADSLLVIINDILDMSKLEAGKMQLERIPFDLKKLITDVAQMFERTSSRAKNLQLGIDFSDDFPPFIQSDPTRLRQILVNLLGNAFKFTEQGGVTISGKLLPEQQLELTISDTGIGMSEETLQELFAEFTQADASISRKYEGSGLGLAICDRLIRLMRGKISARSQLGEGSSFIIQLPYIEAKHGVETTNQDNQSLSFKPLRKLNILAAEDNRLNQIILGKTLSKIDFLVTFVNNGEEAVKAVQEDDYDLILMDIRMPVMNGLDATRAIRRLHSSTAANIPIIALTADVVEENMQEYLAAGMNGYVTKPFKKNDLFESIDQAMEEPIFRLADEN